MNKMGDKNDPFNDKAWEQEIEDENLGEFLPTPSAPSAPSAVSNPDPSFESKKKSKKEKRHSTDDSTRCCPIMS